MATHAPAKQRWLSEHAAAAAAADDDAAPGLAVMLTDVEEGSNGCMLAWGVQGGGRTRSVLVVVRDYQPYVFLPCPQCVALPGGQELREPEQQDLQALMLALNARCVRAQLPPRARQAGAGACVCGPPMHPCVPRAAPLHLHNNHRLPDDLHIQAIEAAQLCPIMFFRPAQPNGAVFLKLLLRPGGWRCGRHWGWRSAACARQLPGCSRSTLRRVVVVVNVPSGA